MGPLFIVFDHPPIGGFSNFIQVTEEVEIKKFIPISPVKAFNVSVPIRFPGLDVLDHHTGGLSPDNKFTTQEFRAFIDP